MALLGEERNSKGKRRKHELEKMKKVLFVA